MAGRFLTALAAFTVSFLFFSFFSTDSGLSRTLSVSKQSLVNIIMSHHIAPLQNCEKPEWVVPNRYTVFLAPGISFAQHKKAIGDQIDLGRFEESVEPFVDDIITYYATFDAAQLSIIRKHESVRLVECVGIRIADSYKAPLVGANNDPKWLAPNRYTVFLAHDISFEQHKTAVGGQIDLNPFAETARPFAEHTVMYHATFDEAQLALIRADRSVESVECIARRKCS